MTTFEAQVIEVGNSKGVTIPSRVATLIPLGTKVVIRMKVKQDG